MTTQHTPGPWKFVGHNAIRQSIVKAGERTIYQSIGDNSEIGDANARLIAASPDLLKTCKSLVRMILGYMEDRRTFSDTLIEKAQQVIDRTEGKER